MRWSNAGALLGFSLAVLALLLLAIAPVGWRAGWWHFRFAFTWLMGSSGVIAAVAAVVSCSRFCSGWSELGAGGVAMAPSGSSWAPSSFMCPGNTIRRAARCRASMTSPPTPPIPALIAPLPPGRRSMAPRRPMADRDRRPAAEGLSGLAPLTLPSAPQGLRSRSATARSMPRWNMPQAIPRRPHRGQPGELLVWLRRRHRHPRHRRRRGQPHRHPLGQPSGQGRPRRQCGPGPRLSRRPEGRRGLERNGP